MSKLILPRRDLIVPNRKQGGFIINAFRFGAGNPWQVPSANVILNFNGTDGSTTMTDDVGVHSWTAGGNAQIDTAQSQYDGASCLFDGTGDRVSSSSHADFAQGTGDFTVAGWVRQPSGQQTGDRILFIVNVGGGLIIALRGGALALGREGIAYDHTSGTTISADAWHHFAVCRASGTLYMFIDGASVLTPVSNSSNFPQAAPSWGGKTSGGTSLNGWLDSCLYIKGTGLYTSAFTPPTQAYSL